jgi:hypothetical protein
MERIRRLSALLMALALVLPQSSCVNNGQVEIRYPLSGMDSVWSGAIVAALYLLPLLLLFVRRFKVSALFAGIAVAAAGLYFIVYGATIAASSLLVGWYTYTVGALVHLASSLVALRHALWPGVPRVDRADGRQD